MCLASLLELLCTAFVRVGGSPGVLQMHRDIAMLA